MTKLFLTIALFGIMQLNAQQVGQVTPEINLQNVDGQNVSLSALKGKVVILDFWASWCGPCKSANKDFVKLYKKYKSKGLEIYSVSVDENKEKWKKAITDQKITWLQVNDPGNWASPTAQSWGIDALPTTFLIDKKGVLRFYNLEGKKLTNKINELLKEE